MKKRANEQRSRPRAPARAAALEAEATVEELAPGGDGVAIVPIAGERRAVFVRGVARGDRVRLAIDASMRPARGRVVSLVEASADRVAPACAYVDRCGGCDWMHVSAEGQLAAHRAHVRGALPAPWRDTEIVTHAAPRPLAYRTRARVHVRASGGRAIVGMNEAKTRDPVEVETCVVLTPVLDAARARIAQLLEGAHGRGEVRLALGAPGATGEARRAVIDLQWSGALPPACFGRVEAAVDGTSARGARAAWAKSGGGWLAGATLTLGESRVPARVGDPTPWMVAGDGAPLKLAVGGFAQASDEGNALLARRVAEVVAGAVGERENARVVELYAGAGNLTVLLARVARRLVAIESQRAACEAARENLAARALGHAKVVEADANEYAIPPETYLVVLDPPRTGARDASARIAASGVRHVVYVSCDPQTLARDLSLLALAAPMFVPRAVETFALFPQTSHVETLVHLERAR